MPITFPSSPASNLQSAFPFTWAKSSLKYLGIQLTDHFDTLYANNHPPLLATVRQDLWIKTVFTLLGRVNIIKMNILPRVFRWCLCPFPEASSPNLLACYLDLCGTHRDHKVLGECWGAQNELAVCESQKYKHTIVL